MSDTRVIVVGTTGDYIEILLSRFSGRMMVVTDPQERAKWPDRAPDAATELLCDQRETDETLTALADHLRRHAIEPSGVACFDCESLILAAHIAKSLSLPFPSPAAVANCRSKYVSKELWRRNGIACPEIRLLEHPADAVAFYERLNRPVVMKPLTGSGSELVFLCDHKIDCVRAFRALKARLSEPSNVRMYPSPDGDTSQLDPRKVFAVEEQISGREYSCDFILDDDNIEIIRIARKIPAQGQPLGTILAYVLPAILPGELDVRKFRRQLVDAAHVVGLDRTMAMVDFIVRRNEAYLLEMTPRPGGDCLPQLMRHSSGFDILGAALDFAEGRPVSLPPAKDWRRLVGVRLFASQAGIIRTLSVDHLSQDPRVISCELKRKPGHEVILPPEDYESRLLGTVIFEPTRPHSIESECLDIAARLKVEMEAPSWATKHLS